MNSQVIFSAENPNNILNDSSCKAALVCDPPRKPRFKYTNPALFFLHQRHGTEWKGGKTSKARIQERCSNSTWALKYLFLYIVRLPHQISQTSFFTPRHFQVERRELVHLFGISRYQAVQSKSNTWQADTPGSPERALRPTACSLHPCAETSTSKLCWFYSPRAAACVPDPRKTSQSKNSAVRYLEPAGQTATVIVSGTAWTHGPMLLVHTLTLWYEIQEPYIQSYS